MRIVALFFLVGVPAVYTQDVRVQPVRVCEVLQDPAAYDSKVLAIVGRYSFRQSGRSLGEEKCGKGAAAPAVRIVFDRAAAPKTPDHLEIDGRAVQTILATMQQQTALAKFRFGTPDYDRWAVVYGRFEVLKGNGGEGTARLVCAGESEIMPIVDRY